MACRGPHPGDTMERVRRARNLREGLSVAAEGLGGVEQGPRGVEGGEGAVLEDQRVAAEDHARQFPKEADEDSEPDDLDDSASCRQVAEKDLLQRGLSDFDRVRHIDTWPEDIVTEFAEIGDVSICHWWMKSYAS